MPNSTAFALLGAPFQDLPELARLESAAFCHWRISTDRCAQMWRGFSPREKPLSISGRIYQNRRIRPSIRWSGDVIVIECGGPERGARAFLVTTLPTTW